jgi:hypothetical protein
MDLCTLSGEARVGGKKKRRGGLIDLSFLLLSGCVKLLLDAWKKEERGAGGDRGARPNLNLARG